MANKKNDLTSTYNAAAIAGTGIAAATVGGLAAFGSLGFGAPLMLGGLAVIGPLWYLSRSMPRKPLEVLFPWLAIAREIVFKETKPLKMPLWQKLLRVNAAAAVIVALAQPQWNPDAVVEGQGPVMLVVDNGWAAARNWPHRVTEMDKAIDRAEKQNRPIIMLATAPGPEGTPPHISAAMSPNEARAMMKDLKPQAWPTDHKAVAEAVSAMSGSKPSALLLSDGVDDENATSMVQALKDKTDLTVVRDKDGNGPRLLMPTGATRDALTVTVRRIDKEKTGLTISASDETGHILVQEKAFFKDGESEAKVVFKVAANARRLWSKLSIDGDNSAGSTLLLDEQWRHRSVGLLGGAPRGEEQIVFSEADFIQKAIGPSVDLHSGAVGTLLQEKVAVIVVTDGAALDEKSQAALEQWTQNGGMLVRFAGEHMAAADKTNEKLLPVELQSQSRSTTNLAEEKSGKIAGFEKGSPFEGLVVPDNVKIERYVEAKRTPDLNEKTWARLEDGTPLVTATNRGKGTIVLVHTSADRSWSNLVLSGLFIDMLTRIVGRASGEGNVPGGAAFTLPPVRVLEGTGQFRSDVIGVKPLTSALQQEGKVSFANPPGIYGNDSFRVAYNLASSVPNLKPMQSLPGVPDRYYAIGKGQTDLIGVGLSIGATLLLLDFLVLLMQRNAFTLRQKRAVGVDNAPRM